jgi:hypothetical protein
MTLMIRSLREATASAALLALMTTSASAASLAPLATFGGGDGWRAPFEVLSGDTAGTDTGGVYNYLGNAVDNLGVNDGNLERGLAYVPTTGHLILVSRSSAGNGIRILDGSTGVDIGAVNQGTGVISGGQFTTNMVGVADDGALYLANLSISGLQPYNIYRWADESSAAPTIAYTGLGATSPLNGARIGDTFDVIGSGADTRLVAGYAANPAVAGNNSFALFSTTDGSSFTGSHISVAGTPPDAGDFRLGISFTDSDTVIGKQSTFARMVDISGTTGTLNTSFNTDGQTLRAMDFAVVDNRPLLAIMECSNDQGPLGRARIFIYDMTDPSLPLVERKILEGSNLPNENPETGPNQFPNGNATGQVKFGPITGNTAIIYAMSTNNGIQAFELTLDLPNNGDYNGDLTVDAADYTVWRDTLDQAAVPPGSGADGDGDGVIGPGDYDHWKARFGNVIVGSGTGVGAAAGVPEPGSLWLATLTMVAGLVSVRPKRDHGR